MKKITQFSVRYPITVLMFVLAILLLGYISFSKLGIDLFPSMNNPEIYIELDAGERPPEEIEKQFVDDLESNVIRQTGVMEVSSIIRTGSARLTVEYNRDVDMDEAFLELQKMITSFSQSGGINDIQISRYDPNSQPVMTIALSHPDIQDMDQLRKAGENYIRNELIRLQGIAEVELSGTETREIVINTNEYLLEGYGLSVDAISAKIAGINRNVSGGSIVELGTRYIIKGVGVFNNIDDIRNVVVAYKSQIQIGDSTQSQNVPIRLSDIADVSYNNKDPENIVSLNGKRCIGLLIYKETKYNTVKAVAELQENLEKIEKSLPGYEFTVIDNQGDYINNSINEVKETALMGIFLAVIVLFVFLRRIGSTLVVSLAIPISVIASFNLMYFTGLTLNIMTLGGLALGAGMLVDNAIVVMENIFRNMESGMSVRDAAINGTAEVGGAITAATFTTIVVFLPIIYLHGVAGEIFKEEAFTVAFALLSSLVVAIFVIPMLSTKLLRKKVNENVKKPLTFPLYQNFLAGILRHKWIVILFAVMLVTGAAFLIPVVGSEFIPQTDDESFTVEIELPQGSELNRTFNTVRGIENRIEKILGNRVENIYSTSGPSQGLSNNAADIFRSENTAEIKITVTQENRRQINNIVNQVSLNLKKIPGMKIRFKKGESALQSVLGTDDMPIVVEIKGKESDILEDLTSQALEGIRSIPELFNLESSFEEGTPEIDVNIDQFKAGIYNISVNQVSSQIQNILSGKQADKWESEGELKDITIKLPDITLRELRDMEISTGGQRVRLDEIADIGITSSPGEILRRNQVRIGKISANVKNTRPFDHIVKDVRSRLDKMEFPPDYSYEITGEELKRNRAMKNLGFALLLSIVLVYMVMASQFESLVHPFTILLTIPLAGAGSVFIFYFLGLSFNIMAVIGIIMLAGIAVNDSIILIDMINQLRRQGMKRYDAILEAGKRRIRPIIMTSLTTILALFPLTLGFGQSASLRAPLALAVIGGLITSTLLTLIVIPCVFDVLDRLRPGIKERH